MKSNILLPLCFSETCSRGFSFFLGKCPVISGVATPISELTIYCASLIWWKLDKTDAHRPHHTWKSNLKRKYICLIFFVCFVNKYRSFVQNTNCLYRIFKFFLKRQSYTWMSGPSSDLSNWSSLLKFITKTTAATTLGEIFSASALIWIIFPLSFSFWFWCIHWLYLTVFSDKITTGRLE